MLLSTDLPVEEVALAPRPLIDLGSIRVAVEFNGDDSDPLADGDILGGTGILVGGWRETKIRRKSENEVKH